MSFGIFFFNDTATTEIYTRSLVGSVKMCIRDRIFAAPHLADQMIGEIVEIFLAAARDDFDQAAVDLSLIHISEPTRPY